MHRATLLLKLRVYHTYKLLLHQYALQGSAVRQLQSNILSHVDFQAMQLWTVDEWKKSCSTTA
eukprot:6378588-Amphidinium_carterae.1